MELKINDIPPSVCLNMIVKNESHIIKETLEMICNKINFTYWVICDTGSTDGTQDIINAFFESKNIPGELIEHKWKNFSHNRTIALDAAFNKTDLLFIFDADDELHGEIKIPEKVDYDGYMLNFGSSEGISYQRVLLVNNRIKWEYKSVIHEFINCLKPNSTITTLNGDYYVVSGRRGSRSLDPDKYLKDAKILEEAYYEAKESNDLLYMRYAFYCANSYKDCGKIEESIKWYKTTLTLDNWSQEKYMCCLNLYNQYNKLGQKETGMFYLVESFKYDLERMECVYHLVHHYLLNGMYDVAYKYYEFIKDFYENRYIQSNVDGKLFVEPDKANLYLPYYMILVSDKVKDRIPSANKTITKMYEIAFTKKHPANDDFYIGNLLYNLQFFIDICNNPNFIEVFQSYIDFLESRKLNLSKYEFLKKFEPYGIKVNSFLHEASQFSDEECKKSNKLLIYTGFCNINWNYTYSLNNPLGGSETAVSQLIKFLSNKFEIYVAGGVAEEKIDNITFVSLNNIKTLVKNTPFHTVIVSRYIAFYEMFPEASFHQSFIWAHDVVLFNYGCNLDNHAILAKWNKKITSCICQTEWHKNLFIQQYPELKDKILTINNGIQIEKFVKNPMKITNRFIYTSCSERGLERLIEIWPQIIAELPDAELFIASYNSFPHNDFEKKLQEKFKKYDNVKHVGSLNKEKLYELMSSAEFWLYPTNFNETSCITSMEMLMSEVICIYYPVAGLVDTLGDYGLPIKSGEEISTILNLSTKQKSELRNNGKKYALTCSWENRADEWNKIIISNNDKTSSTHNISENTDYPIKIINLKNRTDRREKMITKLNKEKIFNYEFFEAVNGKDLELTTDLINLFDRNDFRYKKGIIGCALSHLYLWKQLSEDKDNEFYVILEDDIEFCEHFKTNLDTTCKLFKDQKLEHLSLGEYFSNKPFPTDNTKIDTHTKDLYTEWNTTFAYIISKSAAKKALDYINTCSIKCAFDNPQAFGYILNYSSLNVKLVICETINENGTDIQSNDPDNYFNNVVTNKRQELLKISFCDWWATEYCGGIFDHNNNFFTNLLRNHSNNYIIEIVSPDKNPDILFYSIFGNHHVNCQAKRKIFFSGEPYSQREDADFNLTFDKNSLNNTRMPLWLCYIDQQNINEFIHRNINTIDFTEKNNFCSFIASGPGLTNNRKEFVDKLSKYKKVDCGGNYLNNIGYTVPLGLNCSGKINHNKEYKFAMAFESKTYPGYVTEKICDIFKSNTIPIYWGTKDVVKDFNPKSFINANDFSNFDELVKYIIEVDSNDELYKSFFKQPVLSKMWIDILTDPNKCFFKNIADKITGSNNLLFEDYYIVNTKYGKKTAKIFNIWHNKLFDNCYTDLDEYSLNKMFMYDVNPLYNKIYNKNKNYNIVREYELTNYNNLLQATNYCQTSCLYHIYLNGQLPDYYEFYYHNHYIGFIQYDMVLEKDFIYDIEDKINSTEKDIFFYSLVANDKLDRHLICKPYENSILQKYNKHFNTKHTYDSIKYHEKSKYFICLHTFVIPTTTYMKMMNWYVSISDWLHNNLVSGLYTESMSEVTEEIFGLFLLLQIIENNDIQLEVLKLKHNWPNLHCETSFNHYKENNNYFPLTSIINNQLTDKNSYHSYIDVYETLFKDKQLTTKNVLEIGIERGGSLKLWNDYFVNAYIYGLDINDSPEFLSQYKRIITNKRDAYSLDTVNYFIEQNIKFDTIIDDGPHTLESMIYVIENYTKLLNKDGILIIEDVQQIEWCDKLYNSVPSQLKEFSYKIDRRHIKGTLDDILFIIENKCVAQEILEKHSPQEKNDDLWVFYAFPNHNYKVIEDYINSLNQMYNIVYTQDINYVLSCNPKKISYVMYIDDNKILDKYRNTDVELSFLNTEPLSITYNLDLLKQYINNYPYLKIYDYSFSNLQITLQNNMYAELLEYQFYEKENILLKELNLNENKVYDFGIITYGNTETNTIDSLFYKKKDVVMELVKKGFKVHIISGWGYERDKELAKCKVILNIHSTLGINGKTYYSKTFENIRCDRLLDAGFKILSEDSTHCNDLMNKYKENLKFINYNDFKNIEYSHDVWNKIERNKIKKYCFIHSCNLENVGTYRLDYLVNKLTKSNCIYVFDKIYINNIGSPIENNYGEKFEVINYSNNAALYETQTIELIRTFSEDNHNSYILYLNTKCVSYDANNKKENDWIDCMLHFLVEKPNICVSALDNYYDVVCCNYSNDLDKECFEITNQYPPPYYNGNFWWANTNYLRTLPNLSIGRNEEESWLFKNNPNFYNMHLSSDNNY